MRPRLKSIGLALTQFSVGIATLLFSFAPLPPILSHTEVAHAQTIQERQAEAERLIKQGNRQQRAGEFTAALGSYQQALKIYQEIPNPQGETRVLGRLSRVYFAQKNYPQAIEYAHKQLKLARKIQDYDREFGALWSLYNAYMKVANYAKAIETAEQMIPLAPKVEDEDIINGHLRALAEAYAASGNQAKADEIRQRIDSEQYEDDKQEVTRTQEQNPQVAQAELLRRQARRQSRKRDKSESAIQIYQQALEIYRSIRDRNEEAGVLEELAETYRFQAQYDQSLQKNYDQEIDAYQQALKIYREIGNREKEKFVLFSLRKVYQGIQDLPKAIEYAEQELKLARESRERKRECWILRDLHSFYLSQANYAKAIEAAQSWLSLAPQSMDANEERWALEALVKTYAVIGDVAKSAEYQSGIEQRQQSGTTKPDEDRAKEIALYQQRLAEARKQQDPRREMNAHKALRTQYDLLGDYTRALSHAESGLQIAKEINDRQSVLELALKTGRYYSYLSDWKKALASYMEGIEYHRQHPSSESDIITIELAQLLHETGDAYRKLGNPTQALEFYLQSFALSQRSNLEGIKFVKLGGDRSLADKLTELYIESGNYEKAIETALAILNWRRQKGMSYVFERSALQYLLDFGQRGDYCAMSKREY